MSKAVLVIDMPKNCIHCPCLHRYDSDDWCAVACKVIYSPSNRDKHCPLKPMPEKVDVPDWDDDIKAKNKNAEEVGMYMYDRGHYRGYNICIDKILGN